MSFSTSKFFPLARLLAALCLTSLSACRTDRSPAPAATPTPAPTQAEVARGAYVARNVALCEVCHSERDWSLYSGPPVPGTEGRGGVVGLFGSSAVAPEIRGAALSRWTVDSLAGALSGDAESGPGPLHGGPLLDGLTDLAPGDARAVAAYLLSQSPPLPEATGPWNSTASLLGLESAQAGAYLVRIARCTTCHGQDLAGGLEIELPGGRSLPSANLTMDPTGAGRMSREEFIDFFESLADPALERIVVPAGRTNTAMPWPWLARVSSDDLGSIYDYLGTLDPIATPPTTDTP